MTDKNYIYKKLSDGRYIKEIDDKVEHLASAEEDAKLATDIRSLLQGPEGQAGTSGTSGQDGTSGRDGAEGRIGRTGLTGPRGLNGTSGSSGSSGVDGTSGVDGQKGEKGDRGFKGDKGDRGDKGFPGLQGPAGAKGEDGVIGSSGTSGVNGTSGSSGTSGQDGVIGSSGTSGSSGSSGTSGQDGANGISAGRLFYFNESQSSDVVGYKVLDDVPTSTTQQTISKTLTSNQQNALVQEFITDELGFTVIPAGVQRFKLYYTITPSAADINAFVTLELADSSGTGYGVVATSSVTKILYNDDQPYETDIDIVFPSTAINADDRMIVKLYLNNLDSTSRTVVFSTENGYYSYVITSVGVVGGTSGSSGTSGLSGTSGSSGTSGTSGENGTNGLDTSIVLPSIKSSDYTFDLGDVNKIIIGSSHSALVFTVPLSSVTDFNIGSQIMIARGGTASLGITASVGVNLNSANNFKSLNSQYSGANLIKIDTDDWLLFGDLNV